MTKLKLLIPLLALAIGCKPEAAKMGLSVPAGQPAFQAIPSGLNPNTAQIAGHVGNIVQNSGPDGGAWALAPADGGWQAFPPSTPGVATPSTAGLMSAAQATQLASIPPGLVAQPATYTALIDLTATQTVTLIPSTPGWFFEISGGRWFNITTTGTISTSFTYKVGNDASNVNVIASTTPANTAFSSAPAPSYAFTTVPVSPPVAAVDTSTPINMVITAGATGTGGFAWKARFVAIGYWVPSS